MTTRQRLDLIEIQTKGEIAISEAVLDGLRPRMKNLAIVQP